MSMGRGKDKEYLTSLWSWPTAIQPGKELCRDHSQLKDKQEDIMQSIQIGTLTISVVTNKPSSEALREFCKKILELSQQSGE